jgi:hypothetical protein
VERLHALASSLAGALRGLAVALDVCYYRDTWADRDTWVDKGDTHKAWDAARKALAEYEAATTKDVKP